jgi:hypothetical protein
MASSVFAEWDAGDLTDYQALRSLAIELGEVQSELSPLRMQEARLRDELSRVLAHAGGKAEVPGFGALLLTQPSVTRSYDTEGLNNLCLQLISDGYGPIAEQIARLRRESSRAGSLRITKEKEHTNASR